MLELPGGGERPAGEWRSSVLSLEQPIIWAFFSKMLAAMVAMVANYLGPFQQNVSCHGSQGISRNGDCDLSAISWVGPAAEAEM